LRKIEGSQKVYYSLCLLLFLSGILSSCGYRVAQENRLDLGFSSVAVVPLTNLTTTFQVEQRLTRALTRKIVEKTSWELRSDPNRADAVLEGEISELSVSPVAFGQSSFGTSFLVTMTVRIQLRERESGNILFSNERYIFREQYSINVDFEKFFTEENTALDRIAMDFASSVITSLLEGF
jgi:hypothetical protein